MTNPTSQTQVPASLPMQMYGMLNTHFLVQALYVAASLRIADSLADGPKRVEELAQASASHAPSLYRVLRLLAGAGVFAEEDPGRFRLTPLAGTLRTDTPDSVRDWALFIAAPPVWTAWSDLLHSVRTGTSAFEHAFGRPGPTTTGWPSNPSCRTRRCWRATISPSTARLSTSGAAGA